jgi:hypothetical protein
MKRVLILLFALSACTHKPEIGLVTAVQIPDLPPSLAQKAGPLPELKDPSMAGQIEDATNADMQYNLVSHQLNSVIDIYNCVKISLNEKKDIKTCL